MREAKREITEELYKKYLKMTHKDFIEEIEPTVPIEWSCGYGWYGCRLSEDCGKFYIIHLVGSSCD